MQHRNRRWALRLTVWLWLIIALVPYSAFAEGDTPVVYDRYSLQVSTESEVENDLMTVVLVVEDEDRDSAALADRINQNMLWALLQTEKFPDIKTQTKRYSTSPKYEQNRIVGWRSSQELVLESVEFESVKKAVAILQEKLTVRAMQFTPQSVTRQEAENALLDDALAAFRARASLIQKSMQASSYRVIQVMIDAGRQGPPVYARNEVMAMSAKSSMGAVAAPATDAGTSRIRIAVSGEIQLQ
ncbi:MAG TPA: hypothetical protein DD979_04490 [Gammaproteobacteria bacterium]|nr:hypothetical protein [Gammaproteobacteria bacterium]